MKKTSLLLAFIASTALTAGALAQSTSTGTTGSGSGSGSGTTGTTATTGTGTPSATSPGAGGTAVTSGGSGSSGSSSSTGSNTGGYTGGHAGGFGGQPMLQGMMTCVSPAPMGGFGSFACYPAGWGMGGGMSMGGMNMGGMGMGGMGMGGMGMGGMGWHHMHHGQWHGDGAYRPNDHYKDRQTYRGKRDRGRVPRAEDGESSGPYDEDHDNDWRGNTGGSGHDGSGQDDYSNQ